MTRSDLVTLLAERFAQLTQRDTEFAVKAILDAMSDALARGHRIEIRGFGILGAALGFGLLGDFALVVRDARSERAAASAIEHARHFHGTAPVARTLVEREQRQPRLAVEGRAFQGVPGGLGAVEQAGLHEVLRQRELGAVAVARLQVGAAEQMLVHAHRALEFTAAAEQVAQGKVQFGGVGVVLHGLDESVDGLVLLFVEQQVQALEVGTR